MARFCSSATARTFTVATIRLAAGIANFADCTKEERLFVPAVLNATAVNAVRGTRKVGLGARMIKVEDSLPRSWRW
jgi:hypothetical protein